MPQQMWRLTVVISACQKHIVLGWEDERFSGAAMKRAGSDHANVPDLAIGFFRLVHVQEGLRRLIEQNGLNGLNRDVSAWWESVRN